MNEKKVMDDIIALARECGSVMKNADRNNLNINSKDGYENLVTYYDKMIQKLLKEGLFEILPEAAFVGEEEDEHNYNQNGYTFVVDPIDGTSNFIKDYRMSCVSIGLLKDNRPFLGVIYNPYTDEVFHAIKGQGAYCNNERVHTSLKPLEEGLVLIGTAPYYEELHEKSFKMMWEYFHKSIDIRRSGSAAVDLCQIASGRAELYTELLLQPWDFAAGALIVSEAGGIVSDVYGNDIQFDKATSLVARGINAKMIEIDKI